MSHANITTTLPLRLFWGRRSEDVHNDIASEIGQLPQRLAEHPDRVTMYANNIERLRGQADVLEFLEREFYQIVHWGVDNLWTMQEVLLAQYDVLMGLATAHPDDAGSGRGGDGRRSYNDGRREVLSRVALAIARNEWFPGNKVDKKESV